MPTRKSKKTQTRKSTTKSSVLDSAPKVRLRKPKVPSRPKFEIDDPARRLGELFQDRQFGSDKDAKFPQLRVAAMAAARGLSPINESNTTPATVGGNNWIELGPTAVVNGQ